MASLFDFNDSGFEVLMFIIFVEMFPMHADLKLSIFEQNYLILRLIFNFFKACYRRKLSSELQSPSIL